MLSVTVKIIAQVYRRFVHGSLDSLKGCALAEMAEPTTSTRHTDKVYALSLSFSLSLSPSLSLSLSLSLSISISISIYLSLLLLPSLLLLLSHLCLILLFLSGYIPRSPIMWIIRDNVTGLYIQPDRHTLGWLNNLFVMNIDSRKLIRTTAFTL